MITVHNQIYVTLKRINEKCSTILIEKARQFCVHNFVLVDRCNLQVNAGNNQCLTRQWQEPYKVIKRIRSHAWRLNIPEGTHWYNVVYTTVPKLFRMSDEPLDMDEDDAEVCEVEEIVNSRTVTGVVQY